jgi:hypothetical protein
MLSSAASLNEVRAEFQRLHEAFQSASTAAVAVLAANAQHTAARYELLNRLIAEQYETGSSLEELLSATQRQIAADLALIERARAKLPSEQRRRRTATLLPVQRIHKALVDGWGAAHYVAGAEQDGPPSPVPSSSTSSFPHVPSASPTSPFRQIVGICYEAITGDPEIDPERAIKAYCEWHRGKRAAK